mmetsp:Transcript_137139/g.292933  ORF Transcript_137139/g.292933 Transcript_137139/m.292933 type:complete len:82 (-) Transcript_137139:329-574(-)
MDNADPDKSANSKANGIKSALRGGAAAVDIERLDRHGNVITKGGVHHMSFVDEQKPGKMISDVKEVQAYKNSRPGCHCTIH